MIYQAVLVDWPRLPTFGRMVFLSSPTTAASSANWGHRFTVPPGHSTDRCREKLGVDQVRHETVKDDIE